MMSRLAAVIAALLTLTAAAPAIGADKISDGQWYHTFLKTAEAHGISKGKGVTVAVIDSGVDASHPDLAGSVLPGADFVERGGDGHTDVNGHGTGMAGLIAAHGRVEGIAPEARILPIRAGETGDIASSLAAEGIEWAVEQGAKVISLSFGGRADDLLLRQEIQAAFDADVVVVAGVGNIPKSTSVDYPAAIPGVVAVAGVNRLGNHSSVSVTGPEVVIAAPSDDVSSPSLNHGYEVSTGTSDATAIVAGAVALIRSKYPDLPAKEVVRRLTATATDNGPPGRDKEYGYGVLNLVAALTADLPATETPKATAGATTTATSAPSPSQPNRYLWLLLAVPVLAIAIAVPVWLLRRRSR